MGMVTAVVTKKDLIMFIQNHQLYGGGANINTGTI